MHAVALIWLKDGVFERARRRVRFSFFSVFLVLIPGENSFTRNSETDNLIGECAVIFVRAVFAVCVELLYLSFQPRSVV